MPTKHFPDIRYLEMDEQKPYKSFRLPEQKIKITVRDSNSTTQP